MRKEKKLEEVGEASLEKPSYLMVIGIRIKELYGHKGKMRGKKGQLPASTQVLPGPLVVTGVPS